MTEGEARVLEFPSLRLGKVVVTERGGWGLDRIEAEIGPYRVWLDEQRMVQVADHRIEDEEARRTARASFPLLRAFEYGAALIVDEPGTVCPAKDLNEPMRAAAIWAGAFLLIEGSRYMQVEG